MHGTQGWLHVPVAASGGLTRGVHAWVEWASCSPAGVQADRQAATGRAPGRQGLLLPECCPMLPGRQAATGRAPGMQGLLLRRADAAGTSVMPVFLQLPFDPAVPLWFAAALQCPADPLAQPRAQAEVSGWGVVW